MFGKLIVNKNNYIIILKNEAKAYSNCLEFTSICSKSFFTAGLVCLSSIILCTFFKAFNVVRISDEKFLFLFKIRDIMIAACNKTQKYFPFIWLTSFPIIWETTLKYFLTLPECNLVPLLNYEGGDVHFPKDIIWLAKEVKKKKWKKIFTWRQIWA